MKRKHSMNFKHLIILPFLIAMFIIMLSPSTITLPSKASGIEGEKVKDSGGQLQDVSGAEGKVNDLEKRLQILEKKLSLRNRALNWAIPVVVAIICLFLLYQHFIKNRISGKQEAEEGSLQFRVEDITTPYGLASKLRHPQNLLSQYLRGKFSQTTLQRLDNYGGSSFQSELLQKALVGELNQLLQGDCLYDKQRFAQVQLTEGTRMLIKQKPRGKDLIRLNRLLLEEAYPDEIATSSEKLVPDEQYPNQGVLLQRQSTLNQDVSQIRERLDKLQSQFGETKRQAEFDEKVIEGITAINQTLTTGVATLASTTEKKDFVSEASSIIPNWNNLKENLQRIPTRDSIVEAIASEFNPKIETIASDIKNLNSSLSKIQDILLKSIREEITQKPGIEEVKSPVEEGFRGESQPPVIVGEPWNHFLDFIKTYLKPEDISSLEEAINSASSAGDDPAEKRPCFDKFANAIKSVYRQSIIEPGSVDFNGFVNQFKEQLKLRIEGLDAEGRIRQSLGYQVKEISVDGLEPENPQRKIYDMKLNKIKGGKPQAGQVIALLSPGIRSAHRSDWNILPEVAVYGGNK